MVNKNIIKIRKKLDKLDDHFLNLIKKRTSLVDEVLIFANEAMQSLLDNGEEFTMNNYNNQTIGVA